MNHIIHKTIFIQAPSSSVWAALTEPALMKQWMTESDIDIITTWQVGSDLIMRMPMYKKQFESKGTILQFVPGHQLRYTQLSSISRLPDVAESYNVFNFTLEPQDQTTVLTLEISNFPTETIYKHLAFYWNVALELLRKFIESRNASSMPQTEH